jgi:hypothetical protein
MPVLITSAMLPKGAVLRGWGQLFLLKDRQWFAESVGDFYLGVLDQDGKQDNQ